MKLRERYRRLTFWNKFAFWGSLASIIGLPIGIFAIVIALGPKSHVEYDVPTKKIENKEASSVEEPLLSRTFWILKEKGSSITLGPCPGEKCLKFVLGELEQKEDVFVQRIYVEADFLRFKRHPKYPDMKFMNSGFHSKGCCLCYKIDGSGIWFELAVLKGRMCEVFSRIWNVSITVLDTRIDSLRIKLEVFPGERPPVPFASKNAKRQEKNNEQVEKQIKAGLDRMTRLLEGDDIQGGLLEIEKLLKLVKKDQYPKLYGKLKLNKGYCYLEMGIENNSAEAIRKAIRVFKSGEGLFVSKEKKCFVDCAKLHTNLGTAYYHLSYFENERTNLEASISSYEKAINAFEEEGILEHHDRLKANLSAAKYRLGNLIENQS